MYLKSMEHNATTRQRFIWDMHVCAPRNPGGDVLAALDRYSKAGVSMVAVNVSDAGYTLDQAIRTIAHFRRVLLAEHNDVVVVDSVANMELAHLKGKLGVCFDIEGAYLLGEQVDVVRVLYDLGVRWMSMVYNRRNAFGSGCHDDKDEGLTSLGRELVRTMDEIGMIKCCSHTGYRTAHEVVELSQRPCILSHSNPRELTDHVRNVPDDLMLAVAATGGVVGINGVSIFLGTQAPTVDDVFQRIAYAVDLVGAEHVGVGLDHVVDLGDLATSVVDKRYWPDGHGYHGPSVYLGPDVLPLLAQRMEAAGYPESAICGILGENFKRVAKAVWRTPGSTPSTVA